jgi:hypothetical protein
MKISKKLSRAEMKKIIGGGCTPCTPQCKFDADCKVIDPSAYCAPSTCGGFGCPQVKVCWAD